MEDHHTHGEDHHTHREDHHTHGEDYHTHGEDHHTHREDHHTHGEDYHTHGEDHHIHHDHSHQHESIYLTRILSFIKQYIPIKSDKDLTFDDSIMYAFTATVIISIAPVLILLPLPASNSQDSAFTQSLLSFAAGGLLGDAFLHLIPHAVSPHSHSGKQAETRSHNDGIIIGCFILSGVVLFFLIEKAIIDFSGRSHSHSHSHSNNSKPDTQRGEIVKETATTAKEPPSPPPPSPKKKTSAKKRKQAPVPASNIAPKNEIKISAFLNLIADFTHNYTDGLAIGASFLINVNVGLVTSLTILLHEIPHEVGDFAILVRSGFSKRKAMAMQLLTAVGAMLGTLCGLYAENLFQSATSYILAFTAGGFVYIGCVSILPEMLVSKSKLKSLVEILTFALGISLMVLVGLLE